MKIALLISSSLNSILNQNVFAFIMIRTYAYFNLKIMSTKNYIKDINFNYLSNVKSISLYI